MLIVGRGIEEEQVNTWAVQVQSFNLSCFYSALVSGQ